MLKISRQNWSPIFFTAVLYAGLILAVIWGLPRLRVYKPEQRQQLLQNWLAEVQHKKQLQSALLFELRERYSPGSLSFDPATIYISYMPVFRQPFANTPFIVTRYTAPLVMGTDQVISAPASVSAQLTLTDKLRLASPSAISAEPILYQDGFSLVQGDPARYLKIVTMYPATLMRHHIGVVEYNDKLRNYLRGKFWLSQTEFWSEQQK